MNNWQPIETAPMCDFDNTLPKPCLVWSARTGTQMGRAWLYVDGEPCGQANGFNGDWGITHWMPLPDPPEA